MSPAASCLTIRGLTAGYGPVRVLHGIDLDVNEAEIVAMIGANGAGKSTLLKSVCGLVQPTAGSVRFRGRELAGRPTRWIVGQGIAQVPEGRRLFSEMTVRENLEMGAYLARDRGRVHQALDEVVGLFPVLAERMAQRAGSLSGGEQQMCALGRALVSRPALLLLDEPSMGLAPLLVSRVFDAIERINRDGTTILLVEQNASMALSISHRGYVLQTGRIVLADRSAALLVSPEIRKAYLGG